MHPELLWTMIFCAQEEKMRATRAIRGIFANVSGRIADA
jgi:hypothetical protein